ncbi:MAG: SpoIID/LytB domain-containing protein [Egibacteraceae bacterium]
MRRVALLFVVALGMTLLPTAAPAAAASCPEPGGVRIADAKLPSSGRFVVLGHGWGHGVGMSQYGAQGAASLGCSARTILKTYYPGVQVGSATKMSRRTIHVGLAFDGAKNNRVTALDVEAMIGRVPWQLCGPGGCKTVIRQSQGARWQVRVRANGSFALFRGNQHKWTGGNGRQRLRAVMTRAGGRTRVLSLPTSKGSSYKWGQLAFRPRLYGSRRRALVTVAMPSVEKYLRGLNEVPASWEVAALRAQAIVGRSFAVRQLRKADCACHVYDTVYSQVYDGYSREMAAPRWVDAVRATAGDVIRHDSNRDGRVTRGDDVAVGYYSSSHGGASASSAFVWGGTVPYLKAVDDSRWDKASGNPLRSWSHGISAKALGAKVGVGKALAVRRPKPRGLGGRVGDPAKGYGGIVIEGTRGTVRLSGETFKTRLGLRSTLFHVVKRG